MIEAIIAIVVGIVVGIFIGILFAYFYFRAKVESMARRLGDEIGQQKFEQSKAELEKVYEQKYSALFYQWRIEAEKAFRDDALMRSRAVLKGALAEQLAPMFKVFGHDPSDARFIGDPVDYVIFDGYTKVKERIEDIPITIVLADVKTGEANLTYEQKRIKQGIEKGLVKFEVIRF